MGYHCNDFMLNRQFVLFVRIYFPARWKNGLCITSPAEFLVGCFRAVRAINACYTNAVRTDTRKKFAYGEGVSVDKIFKEHEK